MKLELDIIKAHIATGLGLDRIHIDVNSPSPFPDAYGGSQLSLRFEAVKGLKYLTDTLGIPLDKIEIESKYK